MKELDAIVKLEMLIERYMARSTQTGRKVNHEMVQALELGICALKAQLNTVRVPLLNFPSYDDERHRMTRL